MKDERNSKKMKVVTKLNKKMDLVKQELYNTTRHRQKCRNLVDFEKKQKIPGLQHTVRPIEGFKAPLTPKQKIKGLYEYLWDLRILPLYKLLRDTRKIVLYSEWIYFYREIEITPHGNEILRECKKKNILVDTPPKDAGDELKATLERLNFTNVEKIIRLNKSVKNYFNCVNQIYPEGFNVDLKNTPTTPLFLRRLKEESVKPQAYTVVEKYKAFLNTFRACDSTKSVFFKFNKSLNTTALHQSFINCLKKIPPSRQDCTGVKDLCLSYIPTTPFLSLGEQEEEKDIVEQPPLDTRLDQLIPLKFKIEFIGLYLEGIDPEAITNPPATVFYPFDPFLLVYDTQSTGEGSTQNIIENSLYGHEEGGV